MQGKNSKKWAKRKIILALNEENGLFIFIGLAMCMPSSAFDHAVWEGAQACSIREEDFNDECFIMDSHMLPQKLC